MTAPEISVAFFLDPFPHKLELHDNVPCKPHVIIADIPNVSNQQQHDLVAVTFFGYSSVLVKPCGEDF